MTSSARSRSGLLSLLAASIAMALCGPTLALAQQTATAAAPMVAFNVPSQPLDTALTRLADQGAVRILFASGDVSGITGKGLAGRYTTAQALDQLLAGTPLAWRWREPGIVVVAAATSAQAESAIITTDTLSVDGTRQDAAGAERDKRGYDNVYDLDLSTSYIGKDTIDRYKGTDPADIFKGIAGVQSGEARNSGAIDINIRGIQGPGRVPVTIDGTEQALTVWRGYNGASNRNYIDPFLIGGMQVIKGPSLVRNVNAGIGGAVVINTLDVGDVLKEEATFGGDIRVEGSSNSVDPRLPTLHTGENYTTVQGYPQSTPAIPYGDQTLRVVNKTGGGGYNVLAGGDYAYRVALAWKPREDVDVLGAYAYRQRGNYFSGKHNAGDYANPPSTYLEDYISTLATYFKPGNEVTNTSSQTESWLFKATWRPTDDQAVQLGYRSSLMHYGEIMPSRIANSDDRGAIQWPLSRVDGDAWNLEYKWEPQGSRWIDLYANVWRTNTVSDTYTAGGFPNYASTSDPIIKNTALANATNSRNGITLSNKVQLLDSLDLTIGGNFQHEKLRSEDAYFGVTDGWRMYPRAGRRQEWDGNLKFEWRPADFLTLTAGARYSSYWAFDDFLAAHEGQIKTSNNVGYKVTYRTTENYTAAQVAANVAQAASVWGRLLNSGAITQTSYDLLISNASATSYIKTNTTSWLPDSEGNYSLTQLTCTNGSLDQLAGYIANSCAITTINQTVNAQAKKRKDHGWTPAFSATVHVSDYSRAYLRYTETLRYPSMFESTLAFSAALSQYDLKPEHAHSWELGYVYDFSRFLGGTDSLADIKLAYYSNKTRDVIERDNNFKFNNIDKQVIKGIELSGRYDNGRFFTDLGVNYNLKNEVCDQSSAALLNVTNGLTNYNAGDVVPNCVKYGFPNGYLLTMATPDLSANWSLGGRFLDRRLELGGRFTYYGRYRNSDLDFYRSHTSGYNGTRTGWLYAYNIPYTWGRTMVMDAYAKYQWRDNLSTELTATNLTDQYYVDVATRSAMAAPGRTLKLSLDYRF